MLPLVLESYLVDAAPGNVATLLMLPLVLESYLVDAAPGTGELPC